MLLVLVVLEALAVLVVSVVPMAVQVPVSLGAKGLGSYPCLCQLRGWKQT